MDAQEIDARNLVEKKGWYLHMHQEQGVLDYGRPGCLQSFCVFLAHYEDL